MTLYAAPILFNGTATELTQHEGLRIYSSVRVTLKGYFNIDGFKLL
jgi:hypothetical protein